MKEVHHSEITFRPDGHVLAYRTVFPLSKACLLATFVSGGYVSLNYESIGDIDANGVLLFVVVAAGLLATAYAVFHGFWRFNRKRCWILYADFSGLYLNPRYFVNPPPAQGLNAIHLSVAELLVARKVLTTESLGKEGRFSRVRQSMNFIYITVHPDVAGELAMLLKCGTNKHNLLRLAITPGYVEDSTLAVCWDSMWVSLSPSLDVMIDEFRNIGVSIGEPLDATS